MSERRIFVRQTDGNYAMIGLVASDEVVQEVADEATGERFRVGHITDRYVVYVPDVADVTPVVPDAWKPFVAYGLHDDRQPAS